MRVCGCDDDLQLWLRLVSALNHLLHIGTKKTNQIKCNEYERGLFGLDSAWPVWQPPGGSMEQTVPIAPAGKG